MTERVKNLLAILKKRDYRQARVRDEYEINSEMQSFSPAQKSVYRLIRVLKREKPILFPTERIGFTRHSAFIPAYDTGSFWHSDWGMWK